MAKSRSKLPITSKTLLALHLILGIGAVFGGLVLILDPSGELIHMPSSILKNSPFDSFLIPGLILFVVLGVLPLIVSFALATQRPCEIANRLNLFKEKHWAWAYSLYISFALIIWITLEVYFIEGVALVHVGYVFLGLAIQAVTLLPSVQRHYLRE